MSWQCCWNCLHVFFYNRNSVQSTQMWKARTNKCSVICDCVYHIPRSMSTTMVNFMVRKLLILVKSNQLKLWKLEWLAHDNCKPLDCAIGTPGCLKLPSLLEIYLSAQFGVREQIRIQLPFSKALQVARASLWFWKVRNPRTFLQNKFFSEFLT